MRIMLVVVPFVWQFDVRYWLCQMTGNIIHSTSTFKTNVKWQNESQNKRIGGLQSKFWNKFWVSLPGLPACEQSACANGWWECFECDIVCLVRCRWATTLPSRPFTRTAATRTRRRRGRRRRQAATLGRPTSSSTDRCTPSPSSGASPSSSNPRWGSCYTNHTVGIGCTVKIAIELKSDIVTLHSSNTQSHVTQPCKSQNVPLKPARKSANGSCRHGSFRLLPLGLVDGSEVVHTFQSQFWEAHFVNGGSS